MARSRMSDGLSVFVSSKSFSTCDQLGPCGRYSSRYNRGLCIPAPIPGLVQYRLSAYKKKERKELHIERIATRVQPFFPSEIRNCSTSTSDSWRNAIPSHCAK